MDESLLIDKVTPNAKAFINKQDKVSNFINTTKKWNLQSLHNILPDYIIAKINAIPISINNIEDKCVENFQLMEISLLKQQLRLTIILVGPPESQFC